MELLKLGAQPSEQARPGSPLCPGTPRGTGLGRGVARAALARLAGRVRTNRMAGLRRFGIGKCVVAV